MERIAFFDTKPYDRIYFDKLNRDFELVYFESRLRPESVKLAEGCRAVCAFVNDDIGASTVRSLADIGVEMIAMRCAGYNNVALKEAAGKLRVVRVPAYSPYAVAEHAMGMILMLNRKLHKAYIRTRDFNFSLNGLIGFDLHGKTAGVIGTGKIGRSFIDICRGFGMEVIANDPFPAEGSGIDYVSREELFRRSDIISLHCPLTEDTRYIINEHALSLMKPDTLIVNTSRGKLIDSEALLNALNEKRYTGEQHKTLRYHSDNRCRRARHAVLKLLPGNEKRFGEQYQRKRKYAHRDHRNYAVDCAHHLGMPLLRLLRACRYAVRVSLRAYLRDLRPRRAAHNKAARIQHVTRALRHRFALAGEKALVNVKRPLNEGSVGAYLPSRGKQHDVPRDNVRNREDRFLPIAQQVSLRSRNHGKPVYNAL